jgi:hypothetical protein
MPVDAVARWRKYLRDCVLPHGFSADPPILGGYLDLVHGHHMIYNGWTYPISRAARVATDALRGKEIRCLLPFSVRAQIGIVQPGMDRDRERERLDSRVKFQDGVSVIQDL